MSDRRPVGTQQAMAARRPLVEPGPPLTPAQRERYSRHLLLPHVGEAGQRRLLAARVCVVGAGGLGAPVLQYLAAAGVGQLGIVDVDTVESSNLQRQVIHGTGDVGRPKTESAADAVRRINPEVEVVRHDVRLDAGTADLLADYDLVVDGTDNFPTRYAVNDACVRLGLPEVWASVFRFDAQVSAFWGRPPADAGVAPVQLRDLFPAPPPPGTVPSCAEGGVLGALCGQVGSVMATEAVKIITGIGEPLFGRVLVLDALAMRWAEVPLAGDPAGHEQAVEPDEVAACDMPEIGATALAAALASDEPSVVLVDVREPAEREIVNIPGAVPVPLAGILDGTGLDAIPRNRPVVVHCRSGVRSARAAAALRLAGYADVRNLRGGVLAWADEVDPSLPRY